jgi:hypothetical protein
MWERTHTHIRTVQNNLILQAARNSLKLLLLCVIAAAAPVVREYEV